MYLTFHSLREGRAGSGGLVLLGKVRTPGPTLCIVMGAGGPTMNRTGRVRPPGAHSGLQEAGTGNSALTFEHARACVCAHLGLGVCVSAWVCARWDKSVSKSVCVRGYANVCESLCVYVRECVCTHACLCYTRVPVCTYV